MGFLLPRKEWAYGAKKIKSDLCGPPWCRVTLEQVLADAREEAQILRRNGHAAQAASVERLCEAVAESTEDYRTWLSESDARLQSGRSVEWLRGQFPRWMDQGLARLNGKRREYRALIVPRRANVSAAKEAGRRAGRAA